MALETKGSYDAPAWTWLAVEGAGTEKEKIVHEEEGRGACQRWIRNTYTPGEICSLGVDMVKRFRDGRITTEY